MHLNTIQNLKNYEDPDLLSHKSQVTAASKALEPQISTDNSEPREPKQDTD